MTRIMLIYYNTVFGAIGGLIAWLVVGMLPTARWNLWLATCFIGAASGLFIGGAIGGVEGLVLKRSPSQAGIGIAKGCLAGAASGMVGLLLGQAVFLLTGGGFLGRSLGWIVFGFWLGAGQGIIDRKPTRAIYGAVAGAIAGFLGGLAYEAATQLFLTHSESVQVFLGAAGLVLIGASLGGITALSVEVIERVMGRGLLTVANGTRKGSEVPVIDIVSLGADDACDVYLPGDVAVAERHARVGKTSSGFLVQDLASPGGTFVENQRVPPEGCLLSDGDIIRLGHTLVEFGER